MSRRKEKKGKNIRYENKKAVTIKENTSMFSYPILLSGLGFVLFHFILAFSPDVVRSWGVNYIRFFDLPVIALFYGCMIAVCIPPVNVAIQNFIVRMSRLSFRNIVSRYRILFFILLAGLAGFLFYYFQVKYILLGDMDIRAKQIEAGEMIENEFLTMYLLNKLYILLHGKFGFSGVDTIRLCDYVLGAFTIFFALLTADIAGKTFLQKTAYFVCATLSLGLLLVFFGYTDVYSPAFFLLQIYLYACILHLHGKCHISIPFIVLAAATAVHAMMICLLPAYLFLFYGRVLWKYPIFRKRNTFLLLGLLALPVAYIGYTKVAVKMMYPIDPGDVGLLTMFSTAHFKEFINSQLLASGPGFFLWFVLMIYALRKKIKFDATLWFFMLASVCFIVMLFVFNGVRGSGDWDIFAFGAVVYNGMNIYMLLYLYRNKYLPQQHIKYAVTLVAVFFVLHTSMWIATNTGDQSIKWFEAAVEKDPANYYKKSFNNEALLAAAFSANGLQKEALEWGKKAYLRHPNDPRMAYNYAKDLLPIPERADEGTALLEHLTSKFHGYAPAYFLLTQQYMNVQQYDQLYRLLRQMYAVYAENPAIFTSRTSNQQMAQYFRILVDFHNQTNNGAEANRVMRTITQLTGEQ